MTEQGRPRKSKPQFGLTHAFYANMGGFAFYESDDKETPFESATEPGGTVDVPEYETVIYIMTHFPDIMTNTPEDTILDGAQSSSLGKCILGVQVTWFCINCLSRLAQQLPLTLIEVSTAAHAFCTILTYIVWLSKPMNVAVPTILRGKEAEEVYAVLKCSSEEYNEASAMAEKGEKIGDSERSRTKLAAKALQRHKEKALQRHEDQRLKNKDPERQPLEPPPLGPPPLEPKDRFRTTNDSMLVPGNFSNESRSKSLFVAAISPMLFGPIHILAWFDTFPTPMERMLWYVSSGVVTCTGLVGVCLLLFVMMLDDLSDSNRGLDVLANVITVAVVPAIHMLASGFLIVESFLQLTRLDPPLYQVASWAYYWPRIS